MDITLPLNSPPAEKFKDIQGSLTRWRLPPEDINREEAISTIESADRIGPYVLHAKERLMAISLYIFVHRDVRHLVTGTSKSTVTAGLIGGRLGNKGGVGISVKVAGTSLLFINAHLAGMFIIYLCLHSLIILFSARESCHESSGRLPKD